MTEVVVRTRTGWLTVDLGKDSPDLADAKRFARSTIEAAITATMQALLDRGIWLILTPDEAEQFEILNKI